MSQVITLHTDTLTALNTLCRNLELLYLYDMVHPCAYVDTKAPQYAPYLHHKSHT